MPGPKTNERPGTRAVLRHYRMSATKARQVLDLVRGLEVDRADELLRSTPREAARVVSKVLASAVANARNNDGLEPDELYIAACYADEGATAKRWRPRARGRATRIRKRTCHITVIVARLPEDRLERRRARQAAAAGALRARRVAASRRAEPTGAAEAQAGAEAQAEETGASTAADQGAAAEATRGNRATRRARARGKLPAEEPAGDEGPTGEADQGAGGNAAGDPSAEVTAADDTGADDTGAEDMAADDTVADDTVAEDAVAEDAGGGPAAGPGGEAEEKD